MNQESNNFNYLNNNNNNNNNNFNNQTFNNIQNFDNTHYENQSANVNQTVFDNSPTVTLENYTNVNNTSISNTNNNFKQNKFKIIGLVIIIFIILFICIFWFYSSNSNKLSDVTKSGEIVNQGQEIRIKNFFTDITLKVEDFERNVKLSSIFDSSNNDSESFTKIKITIINHNDKDSTSIGFLNSFNLLDKNKNEIENGSCLTKTWMSIYDVNDAILSEIPANSTDTGYLYCRDEKNIGDILEITSFTSFDEELLEQDIIKSTGSDIFYVLLK